MYSHLEYMVSTTLEPHVTDSFSSSFLIFIYFLLSILKCCANVLYCTPTSAHINAALLRCSSTLQPGHVFGPPGLCGLFAKQGKKAL